MEERQKSHLQKTKATILKIGMSKVKKSSKKWWERRNIQQSGILTLFSQAINFHIVNDNIVTF